MEPTASSLYPRLDFEVHSVQVDSEKLEPKHMDSKLQINPIDEDVVCKNGQSESNREELINLQNNQDNDTTLHRKHKFKKMFLIFVGLALVMLLIGFLTGSLFQQKGYIQVWNGSGKSELIRKSWNLDTRENVKRRDFIRQMMRNAWNAYETHAWGCDWLKPVTRECVGQRISGGSMIASMSTLWVMGLNAEFERAREWVHLKMDFENIGNWVSVSDAVTGQIGGLLSCFALTGDRMFVDKASVIARKLAVVYDHSKFITHFDRLPNDEIRYREEPVTDVPFPYQELIPIKNTYGGNEFKLSHIAQQLEYTFLADITQDGQFEERLEPIWRLVQTITTYEGRLSGLYFSRYSIFSHGGINEKGDKSTLWEDGSEFYANLLKAYLQSNGAQHQLIDWYLIALDALERNGPFVRAPNSSSSSSLYYTKELLLYRFVLESKDGAPYFGWYKEFLEEQKQYQSKMHITSCYIGAMLGLSASLNQGQINTTNQARWMDLAENMTDGCQLMSDSTKTGLMPREWDFADGKQNQYHYELSPQLAQSYFILWRLTHNQKYRDNAWKMVQAIEKHCRVEGGGYSSIHNVDQVPTVPTNIQPPHFLSATLKYLYLTFTPDSVLPLDQWVFNSAGHPLPICGTSDAYPNCGFSFTKLFKQTYRYLVKLVS